METPGCRQSPLPLYLPLTIALGFALVALPARAQPGASWTESGYVDIFVYPFGSASRVNRAAANVLESDTIDEIVVGKNALVTTHQTGTLEIEGIGEVGMPRALGDVFIDVGLLELNDAIVGDTEIRLGVTTQTQFHDPSQGTLSVTLSDVSGDVVARNGFLGCQASRIHDVTVLALGRAQIAGCVIEAFSSSGGSESQISGSTLNVALPNFRGDTVVQGGTITSVMGTVVEGAIEIGGIGTPTDWDASGTITVGQNALTTLMTVTESTIESGTAYVRGSGTTELVMRGAAAWRAVDLFQFQGSTVTADLDSASRIESLGDLWIGQSAVTVRSATSNDSRIDVAGDLELGRFSAASVTSGTLTIEDGGEVAVDGTLTIHPLATLNLNGGTLRVGALVELGTLNENGGTLIVPEPETPGLLALSAVALLTRRRARAALSPC